MITENADDFINDDFAEEITYQPHVGDAVDIMAIVNDDFPNQEDHPQTGSRFAVAEVIVKVADIQAPGHRDRFTFHGYTWEVSGDGYQKSNILYTVNLERTL